MALVETALISPALGDSRLLPGDEVITIAAGFPTTVNPTDLAEATELLSWKPRYTLEETVRAFWHEFLTRTETGRPV